MANPFLSVVTDGKDEKPKSTNPFMDVVDNTRQNLGVADVHASEFAPDQYAQASRISSQIGIPAPVVARNPEEANRIARQKRLDVLTAENPNLASWLGKTPNAMTFSKDELEHMSFSEKVVQNLLNVNPFADEQTNTRITKRLSGASAKIFSDLSYTVTDRQDMFFNDDKWNAGLEQYAKIEKQARDAGHQNLANAIKSYSGFFNDYRNVVKQSKQGSADFGADISNTQAQMSEGVTRSDRPFEYYGGMIAESLPAMSLAMSTGGATAASVTMGTTTYNSAYTDSRESGLSPVAANANASIQAGLEVFFERYGLGKAFGPASTIGKRAVQTVGREAVSEAATTLTQNPIDALFKGEAIDPAKLFADAFDAAVVGGAMGGPEAVMGIRKDTQQAKIEADNKKVQDTLKQVLGSTSNAAQLQTLSAIAQDMKLADRSPETAMDYAKTLIESGAPESIFVDGTAFRELFQSEQAAQDAALQFTNDPSAYPLAMSTGGDIVIPLPQYLALAMKSPQAQEIAGLARKNQEDLSAAELANYTKDDFIADVTGVSAEQRTQAAAQVQAEDKQISDAVIGQLVAANVEQGAAEKYAKLYTSFFRTLGTRTGQSATELFGKYMPAIQRQLSLADPSVGELFQGLGGLDSFRNMAKADFLGTPKITSLANASDLKPKALSSVAEAEAEPFIGGLSARYSDYGVAVYDGDSVVASYNFGDTLVVDKKYRRRGIAEEMVYQWRTRNPSAPPAKTRTKASQAIQEKVWARIQKEISSNLFQPADGDIKRGSYKPQENLITLFERADLSTLLHESGHFFLEVMGDMAAAENAPAQIQDDYAAVLRWFGVESREAITVENHEQFARGFEAYLFEGKAPSVDLASAFGRFRAWLVSIYQSLKSLNVNLSPEIRGVFDRLVAADEEIELANLEQSYEPILKSLADAKALGLTERQYEAYVASTVAAADEGKAEVTAKLLNALRREAKGWYKEQLAELKAQISLDVDAMPVYRAIDILRTGKLPDGTELPIKVKLDKASLVAVYGQEFVDQKLKGVTGKEGVTADEAAGVLGFANGADLVKQIAEAKPKQELIDALAKQQMNERHPDPMNDGTLADEAMQAAHNSKRVQVLEHELAVLAKAANQPAPKGRILKAIAEAEIAKKRVRDIRPNEYLIAERKAANLAAKLAAQGKYAEAFMQKRAQALNVALYRAALEANKDVDRAQKLGRKLEKDAKLRGRIGKAENGLLEQIDSILEQYSFRDESAPAVDRRKAQAAMLAAAEAGDIMLSDSVKAALSNDTRENYQDLTAEHLRGVIDTLKQLKAQALAFTQAKIDEQTFDLEQVDEAMAQSVQDAHGALPDVPGDKPAKRVLTEQLVKLWGFVGAPTNIARDLDGQVDTGSVWENTIGIIRRAVAEKMNPALRAGQEAIANLYLAHYTKAEIKALQDKRSFDFIDGEWSKQSIMSLALNWGNPEGRTAILGQDRGRITAEQVGRLLGTLDAKDLAFVNGVWPLVDAYWPDLAKLSRRMTGLVPAKVQATGYTVTLADGNTVAMSGGYFPLKYEANTAQTVREVAGDAFKEIQTGKIAKASTRRGMLIERKKSGGRTVQLDLGNLDSHVRDTVRAIHLTEPVNYVSRVLRGQKFMGAASDAGMAEHVAMLDTWLRDVATGEKVVSGWHASGLRYLRQNFTAAVLTYKVSSAALQITGLAQSSVVLGKRAMSHGLTKYAANPMAAGKYVDERSAFMKERSDTMIEAIQDLSNARKSTASEIRSYMIAKGYYMIGRVQRIVDVITWIAAERKGMAMFGDAAKAQAYADDIVSRAQSSQEFIDKNWLQRGNQAGDKLAEAVRSMTTLQSYMYAKLNVAKERTQKTNFKDMKQAANWAGDMVMLYAVEGVIVELIRSGLPDDEEEDGVFDDWIALAGKQAAGNVFGGIPGVSQIYTEMRGYDAKGVVSGFGEALERLWGQVSRTWDEDKEVNEPKLIKSAVNVGGFLYGIPSSQINKTMAAINKANNGEEVSALEYINGPKK